MQIFPTHIYVIENINHSIAKKISYYSKLIENINHSIAKKISCYSKL